MGLRWAVGPLGFWQLRLLGTGAGPVALTGPWQESGALDSAAVLHAWLLFPGPERQLPQAAGDGPDGLRYKGYGDGVCQTHPSYVAHAEDDVPDGIHRGADGSYHLMDNHGEDNEMEYVPVHLPVPRDGRGFSCGLGFSGVAGWRIVASGWSFMRWSPGSGFLGT